MAETHTFVDARTDTLKGLFAAATYLNAGLPSGATVTLYKGPQEAGMPEPVPWAIYISRAGLPSFEYGVAGDPTLVTQEMVVACVSSYPSSREEMEEYVSYLAANTIRVLLGGKQVAGASGWHKGIITGSDALTIRNKRNNTTAEVELFGFSVEYEVSP